MSRLAPLLAGLLLTGAVAAAAPPPLPEPLTLGAALAAVDDHHPTLAEAYARHQQAQAGYQLASAERLPTLNLETHLRYLEAYDQNSAPGHNDSHAQLRLQQTLYDFGRSEARLSARDAERNREQYALLESRQQQQLEVMRRFFAVLLADLAQSEAHEAMALAYIRFNKANERQQLGQLSDIERLDQERNYQQMRVAFLEQQAAQRLTRTRLASALNRPQQLASRLVTPPPLERLRPPLEELLQEARDHAPLLARLRAELAAASSEQQAAERERWPLLRGELIGSSQQREVGARSGPFSAALVLEVALFDGGMQRARTAQREAETQQQRARLAQAELLLREQLTELWLQLDHLQQRREALRALANYQELYLDRSRALYELEFTADLGDAMTQTSAVRLQQASNEFELALTWAQIDALRGQFDPTTLFSPATEEPNR